MKYIITESQYNNTIDKFITYYLEPHEEIRTCLLYTSPSPRDRQKSRMPSSA